MYTRHVAITKMENALGFEPRIYSLGQNRIFLCAMRSQTGGSTQIQTEIADLEEGLRPIHWTIEPWRMVKDLNLHAL